MAVNKYVNQSYRPSQILYEDLIVESLKMYGQDVYYIPRDVVEIDKILSDEILAKFYDSYKIEMYIENTEGFEGEGDLFTKFGIEIRDAATFIVSRRRWNSAIGSQMNEGDPNKFFRPREGDLIHMPLSNSTFQVMKVYDEQPFYQLNNLPVFRLSCELFEYADEDFETGVEQIDAIERVHSYQWMFQMDTGVADYIIGEPIIQAFGDFTIHGEVMAWHDSDQQLFVGLVGSNDGKFRQPAAGVAVKGSVSLESLVPSGVSEVQNISPTAQNDDFQDYTDTFANFDESNPFGDLL